MEAILEITGATVTAWIGNIPPALLKGRETNIKEYCLLTYCRAFLGNLSFIIRLENLSLVLSSSPQPQSKHFSLYGRLERLRNERK